MKRSRFFGVLALFILLFSLGAMPAAAEDNYEDAVSRLSQLQALAESYVSETGSTADPIVLTLSYTRVGDYNTNIWQMTAGVRDPEFESYVAEKNGDLINLQGLNSTPLPNGQYIDFGHLLASINLVYNGIPITGSWGGDCMELARNYQGQATDAEGYISLMQSTFNMADDGSNSFFGDQDLRADLDSVVIGSGISKGDNIADAIRAYYTDITDYDRAYRFTALSFGTVDTGSADFRETVYNTLVKDTGMQLLLYINTLWSKEGWTVAPEAEPALRGAAYVFADYLSGAVNGEKVKSSSSTLMATMAGDALSAALSALGDADAASAAAAANAAESVASSAASGSDKVSNVLNGATETFKGNFDVNIFQTILMVLAGLAVLVLLVCIVMLIRHR